MWVNGIFDVRLEPPRAVRPAFWVLTDTRQLGFLHSNGFFEGQPREFFGLAHMNEHRTAVLTHYYALESASAGRGCHKTAFFYHSTPRCAPKKNTGSGPIFLPV